MSSDAPSGSGSQLAARLGPPKKTSKLPSARDVEVGVAQHARGLRAVPAVGRAQLHREREVDAPGDVAGHPVGPVGTDGRACSRAHRGCRRASCGVGSRSAGRTAAPGRCRTRGTSRPRGCWRRSGSRREVAEAGRAPLVAEVALVDLLEQRESARAAQRRDSSSGSVMGPLPSASFLTAGGVEVLQEVVRGELDLLVAPLRGPVHAGDEAGCGAPGGGRRRRRRSGPSSRRWRPR